MSKISFTKLGLKKNEEIAKIMYNDNEVEVKLYLPIEEKLKLISNVINKSMDENNFNNSLKVDAFTSLEIIYAYTNISFTDKQKEDEAKLYDLLEGNGVINMVISALPTVEYETLIGAIEDTIADHHEYQRSALGILERVSADYSDLNFDVSELEKKLTNGENVGFLKEVLAKMD